MEKTLIAHIAWASMHGTTGWTGVDRGGHFHPTFLRSVFIPSGHKFYLPSTPLFKGRRRALARSLLVCKRKIARRVPYCYLLSVLNTPSFFLGGQVPYFPYRLACRTRGEGILGDQKINLTVLGSRLVT